MAIITAVVIALWILPSSVIMQSIPTYYLCSNSTVRLPAAQGVYDIEHVVNERRITSGSCELRLKVNIERGSYVLISGAESTPTDGTCTGTELIFGVDKLCVAENSRFVWNANSFQNELVIKMNASDKDFRIRAYLSGYDCGTSVPNPPLSGVISSSPPGRASIQFSCTTTLNGLPSSATLKFMALKDFSISGASIRVNGGNGNTESIMAAGQTVYMDVPGSRILTIQRVLDFGDEDPARGQFMLAYSVIRCGDIPEIENTTHTPLPPPYLPGSTVQYSCGDNYQFKIESHIICEEKIQGEAVWSDDVMCIPVPWCSRSPQHLDNTNKRVITTNRTVSYECEEGFESTYGPNITVTCSTTDEDRQPWRWNDTNIAAIFQCHPVQCGVDMISNINNGALDNNNNVAYNYRDTATYECDTGYKKKTTEPIRCQSDKSWSAVPVCDPVYCTRIPNTPNQLVEVQSNSTGNKLAYGEVITIKCVVGYKLLSQNLVRWTCSQSESWVLFDDDSIEYDEQLLPLCGKSDNSEGDTDSREGIQTPRYDMSTIVVSSVLGVVCFLLIIVIVVFIRLYNITPQDIKQRIAKKGVRTDQFEAGVEDVRHAASESVIGPDEYEDVSVGPAGVNISMNAVQTISSKSVYEKISPRVASGSTYENTLYQGDQGDGHEYAKLGQ